MSDKFTEWFCLCGCGRKYSRSVMDLPGYIIDHYKSPPPRDWVKEPFGAWLRDLTFELPNGHYKLYTSAKEMCIAHPELCEDVPCVK